MTAVGCSRSFMSSIGSHLLQVPTRSPHNDKSQTTLAKIYSKNSSFQKISSKTYTPNMSLSISFRNSNTPRQTEKTSNIKSTSHLPPNPKTTTPNPTPLFFSHFFRISQRNSQPKSLLNRLFNFLSPPFFQNTKTYIKTNTHQKKDFAFVPFRRPPSPRPSHHQLRRLSAPSHGEAILSSLGEPWGQGIFFFLGGVVSFVIFFFGWGSFFFFFGGGGSFFCFFFGGVVFFFFFLGGVVSFFFFFGGGGGVVSFFFFLGGVVSFFFFWGGGSFFFFFFWGGGSFFFFFLGGVVSFVFFFLG